MKWFIYILECSDKSLYTGVTPDISKRLKTHSSGKGSAYVRSKLPIKLVYREVHSDKSSALKREAAIKCLSRKNKINLINRSGKTHRAGAF